MPASTMQRTNYNGDKPVVKEPAFKCRTIIELDLDLAYELGKFILDNPCPNAALAALGHQLTGD